VLVHHEDHHDARLPVRWLVKVEEVLFGLGLAVFLALAFVTRHERPCAGNSCPYVAPKR
jgi:hypothetical protein